MILIKPHLTEKSIATTANSGFTFEVESQATKSSVKHAVEQAFQVHVTGVTTRINHVPSKSNYARRTKSAERIQKFATVYLKKGETIALFEFKDQK